jgi:hypothetical protein
MEEITLLRDDLTRLRQELAAAREIAARELEATRGELEATLIWVFALTSTHPDLPRLKRHVETVVAQRQSSLPQDRGAAGVIRDQFLSQTLQNLERYRTQVQQSRNRDQPPR